MKRWVCACQMCLGRVFQKKGEATEKALSPQAPSWVLVVFSVVASTDLRDREGVWWRMRLER